MSILEDSMCLDCSPSEGISRREFLGAAEAVVAASAFGALGVDSALAGETAKRVDAICRPAWGARRPTGSFVRHEIKRLTVHHSGNVFWRNRDAPARFRSMQRDHQAEGWPDIAYHVLIDRHGNVYRARPPWARGNTRTNYNPRGHLLVMCIGNFSEQDIARPQLRALVDVLAWACARFGVAPRTIGGHREYAATTCPGGNLQRRISSGVVQRRVRRRLAEGGVRLRRLCGEEGRQRVRAIESGNDL